VRKTELGFQTGDFSWNTGGPEIMMRRSSKGTSVRSVT
jgi:viroplasmin and RNaseH domain-containing protein